MPPVPFPQGSVTAAPPCTPLPTQPEKHPNVQPLLRMHRRNLGGTEVVGGLYVGSPRQQGAEAEEGREAGKGSRDVR